MPSDNERRTQSTDRPARLPQLGRRLRLALGLVLLCLGLLVILPACSSDSSSQLAVGTVSYPESIPADDYEEQQKVEEDNALSDDELDQVRSFGYRSACNTLEGQADENGTFSPVSLYYALALTGSGAAGNTQNQIYAALGAGDTDSLSERCGRLFRLLYQDDGTTTIKLANSLWMQKDFPFEQSFVDNATKNFYATPFSADFGTTETDEAMASWISQQTDGTLAPTFHSDASQVLSIVNTIYFHDAWQTPFDATDTTTDLFHAADGSEVQADYLTRVDEGSSYFTGDGYTRCDLYMAGGNRMVFLLPDEGTTTADLLSDPSALQAACADTNGVPAEVTYRIPKFSFDSSYDLKDDLGRLGVTDAFTDDADFSAMTSGDVLVSSVVQETHIALDENGVEASAYTKVDVSLTALLGPEEKLSFTLDRPFVYVLLSSEDVPLFVGTCANPSA